MTYIVNDACVKCKYQDCVSVCPVDCFYVGPNMLVINPDECIDCGVCEPECPADAIVSDYKMSDETRYWLDVNTQYSKVWPNIRERGDPPVDADAWNPKLNPSIGNKKDKFEP